jgi:iron(III) transport system ATP-binding protein
VLAPGKATDELIAGRRVAGADCWVVRPERLALAGPGETPIPGTVSKYTYLGREAHVMVDTPVGRLVIQIADPGTAAAQKAGDPVSVRVEPDALMCFDAAGRRLPIGR